MGNFTNETHLSYTVCGFPMPTVTWGSTENIADGFINGSTKNVTYYAHKYGLFVTLNMCDVLFFKAVGYKNKTISWRKNMKNCKHQFYSLYFQGIIFRLFFWCFFIISCLHFGVWCSEKTVSLLGWVKTDYTSVVCIASSQNQIIFLIHSSPFLWLLPRLQSRNWKIRHS